VPARPALDLHEELSTPRAEKRCTCGPAGLRLLSGQGELVGVRGGCVNRCAYCAKLAAIENCEMLALDAMEGDAPEVLVVLTTRTATIDMARFSVGLEKVLRALRRRWSTAEYASLVEFTTGYAERSGGLRRPHWNLLLKGVPAADAELVQQLAARIWCQHVDAEPAGQHAAAIYAAGGLMRYLALHFQKASQQPPDGFTGQRFNCSRGYFTGCTRAVARRRAREALRLKRELWKARELYADLADVEDPDVQAAIARDVELTGQRNYRQAVATRWVLATDRGARLSATSLHGRPLSRRLAGARELEEHGRREQLRARWRPERSTLFAPGPADLVARS
jgi:hypothetical protein